MAITRIKSSGIYGSKSDSALAGIPGIMPAPTATDAALGGTVNVAFTAITGNTSYGVISTPESITATGTSSPIAVTGLTDNTSYTFQIRGVNAQGNGAYSAASNSVTPTGTSYDSIASLAGNGSSATVTFSNIPQTYQSLQIRGVMIPSTNDAMFMRMNGITTTSYNFHYMSGSGTGVFAGAGINQNTINVYNYTYPTPTYPQAFIIDIQNYASTTQNKTIRCFTGNDQNGAGAVDMWSGTFRSTAAVTSLSLFVNAGTTLATASSFALYGIKGA